MSGAEQHLSWGANPGLNTGGALDCSENERGKKKKEKMHIIFKHLSAIHLRWITTTITCEVSLYEGISSFLV